MKLCRINGHRSYDWYSKVIEYSENGTKKIIKTNLDDLYTKISMDKIIIWHHRYHGYKLYLDGISIYLPDKYSFSRVYGFNIKNKYLIYNCINDKLCCCDIRSRKIIVPENIYRIRQDLCVNHLYHFPDQNIFLGTYGCEEYHDPWIIDDVDLSYIKQVDLKNIHYQNTFDNYSTIIDGVTHYFITKDDYCDSFRNTIYFKMKRRGKKIDVFDTVRSKTHTFYVGDDDRPLDEFFIMNYDHTPDERLKNTNGRTSPWLNYDDYRIVPLFIMEFLL